MTSPRQRLIDAGIRLLEDCGPEALQARKVAAEVGASTMAVYHHFGGMAGLLEQIAREALIRFGQAMKRVPRTDDPVADLMALGMAYRDYALANRQRYRLMFGATAPGTGRLLGRENPVVDTASPTGEPALDSAYEQLVEVVRRSMAAGRIRDDDAIIVAGQF
ncbi:MAG: TetR/AcrR family transcriptional regulator, partial [Sciscionella sp.]|nr:TetR/AcrR family transcriptional regulator [Sciscionella sp.]